MYAICLQIVQDLQRLIVPHWYWSRFSRGNAWIYRLKISRQKRVECLRYLTNTYTVGIVHWCPLHVITQPIHRLCVFCHVFQWEMPSAGRQRQHILRMTTSLKLRWWYSRKPHVIGSLSPLLLAAHPMLRKDETKRSWTYVWSWIDVAPSCIMSISDGSSGILVSLSKCIGNFHCERVYI